MVPAAPPDAAAPVSQSAPAAEPEETPPPETFGTRALDYLTKQGAVLRKSVGTYTSNIAVLPQEIGTWFERQTTNARLIERWTQIGTHLLLAIGSGLAAGFAVQFFLRRPRKYLREKQPKNFARKIGFGFAWLGIALIPLVVFLATSLGILSAGDPPRVVRLVVLSAIYALTLTFMIVTVGRMILRPYHAALRLIHVDDQRAQRLMWWLRILAILNVCGYFIIDILRVVALPAAPRTALASLLALAVVALCIKLVMEIRAPVAIWIRGKPAPEKQESLLTLVRRHFAAAWHILIVIYLIAGYFITILGVENGFVIMLRGTAVMLISLVGIWLLLHLIGHLGRKRTAEEQAQGRFSFYLPFARSALRLVVWILGFTIIFAGWGADIIGLLTTEFGQYATTAILSVAGIVAGAILFYEFIDSIIERYLTRTDESGTPIEPSARLRTLLPLLRTSIVILLIIIVLLAALTVLGIDITPLLAGAGIIGIAVGFGSQSLVKDIITGLFIILEETIQVGDIIQVNADHGGVVEAITLRTLRLRDLEGNLHVIPFGDVSSFLNRTRGFANTVIIVGVSYSANLRRVMQILEEVGEELRKDIVIGNAILAPIEIHGVTSFNEYSVSIRCRFKTRPGQQWNVRFAFNLRLKERFDKDGIEIPFPTITHLFPQEPASKHVETLMQAFEGNREGARREEKIEPPKPKDS